MREPLQFTESQRNYKNHGLSRDLSLFSSTFQIFTMIFLIYVPFCDSKNTFHTFQPPGISGLICRSETMLLKKQNTVDSVHWSIAFYKKYS